MAEAYTHYGLAEEARRHLVDGIQEQVHEQLTTLEKEITRLIGAPQGAVYRHFDSFPCPVCGREANWIRSHEPGRMSPHYQCSAGCRT